MSPHPPQTETLGKGGGDDKPECREKRFSSDPKERVQTTLVPETEKRRESLTPELIREDQRKLETPECSETLIVTTNELRFSNDPEAVPVKTPGQQSIKWYLVEIREKIIE